MPRPDLKGSKNLEDFKNGDFLILSILVYINLRPTKNRKNGDII